MSWGGAQQQYGGNNPGAAYDAPIQAIAPVRVQIHRNDTFTPWGFRIQGGRDYRQQLQVKKVNPGSPAQGRLNVGDAITAIGGYDAANMTHAQATNMIKNVGTSLELTIQKGQFRSIKPAGPVKFSPGKAHQSGY